MVFRFVYNMIYYVFWNKFFFLRFLTRKVIAENNPVKVKMKYYYYAYNTYVIILFKRYTISWSLLPMIYTSRGQNIFISPFANNRKGEKIEYLGTYQSIVRSYYLNIDRILIDRADAGPVDFNTSFLSAGYQIVISYRRYIYFISLRYNNIRLQTRNE